MAEISVIVPVYNAEKFLGRCIESVLNQTFVDLELILVDDGSPDGSGAICDAYAQKDNRIHVIHQKNAGVCIARNNALDWVYTNSGSQWIFFIDNDDWMHPKTLELLYSAAVENGLNLSICGYSQTAGENPDVKEEACTPVFWNTAEFYQTHFVNATVCWGKLYHRSLFQDRRYPPGKFLEDEFLTYRLLFENQQLAVIPAPLYAYFYNEVGITKSKWKPKRLDAWEAYEQQIAFFTEKGMQELVCFRYREYLEGGMRHLAAAEEYPEEYAGEIRYIEKRMRSVIRRAWKCGCITFWIDYDMLHRFYPLLTRIYRPILEWKVRRQRRKEKQH